LLTAAMLYTSQHGSRQQKCANSGGA